MIKGFGANLAPQRAYAISGNSVINDLSGEGFSDFAAICFYSRPLTHTAGSLGSSEGSEKRIVADVFRSLKESCKAGRPDMVIGTNGEVLKVRKKLAFA